MKTLSEVGEIEAIRQLCTYFHQNSSVVCGPGDDCAVVRDHSRSDTELLLTSDPLIQGVHFQPGTPAEAIGRKAIGRVLSDIAAMGGAPAWALVNIAAPPSTCMDTVNGIGRGIASLADKFSTVIAGGDLAESAILEINTFAVGTVPAGKAVLRSTARPGDRLYVTGSLGGSILGKHLSFIPRVNEGIMLRTWATSMIDISDGLATDLRHICDMSGVGAMIKERHIPISPAASDMKDFMKPLIHALCDGEDFELLFTIPENMFEEFEKSWSKTFKLTCTCIGYITDQPGILEIEDLHGNTVALTDRGFEHFDTKKA